MDPLNTPHILVAGNPVDGLTFQGPFADHQTAAEAGEEFDGDWWVAPLGAPHASIGKPNSAGTATVSWVVEVFDDEVPEFTAIEVARKAYYRITSHQMRPILTVGMPDGTTQDIDIDQVGA